MEKAATEMVTFSFHGDQLKLLTDEEGVWVEFRRLCDHLGLDYNRQVRKLKSRSWCRVAQKPTLAIDGKVRLATMIHLDRVGMWLANVNEHRVDPAIRDKLIRYQNEIADAISAFIFGKHLPTTQDTLCLQLQRMNALEERIDALVQANKVTDEKWTTVLNRLSRIEAAFLNPAKEEEYYSVREYMRKLGFFPTDDNVLETGRLMRAFADRRYVQIEYVFLGGGKKVNKYPETLLKAYFDHPRHFDAEEMKDWIESDDCLEPEILLG